MSKEVIDINKGRFQNLENGDRVEVVVEEDRKIEPSGTAKHEAKHAVVAEINGTSTEMATIVPGADYSGLTQLSRFDAVAAVAPHATGEDGTGFDVFLVKAMGRDLGAASAAARSIISANGPEVEAVAQTLEENKTISGNEIRKEMSEARKPKTREVVVFISSPDGTEKKFKEKAEGNLIKLVA